MAAANQSDLQNLEQRIQGLKDALSKISEERWRATLSRDQKAVVDARIRASEKTLENCNAIANYVKHLSPPLSKEIQMGEQRARIGLEEIKRSGDAVQLHKWIKTQLIPHARMSERLGHLAVSSVQKVQGAGIDFHRWTPSR